MDINNSLWSLAGTAIFKKLGPKGAFTLIVCLIVSNTVLVALGFAYKWSLDRKKFDIDAKYAESIRSRESAAADLEKAKANDENARLYSLDNRHPGFVWVADPQGIPIEKAEVKISENGVQIQISKTNEDGRLSFSCPMFHNGFARIIEIEVTHTGYHSGNDTLACINDNNSSSHITLKPVLNPVVKNANPSVSQVSPQATPRTPTEKQGQESIGPDSTGEVTANSLAECISVYSGLIQEDHSVDSSSSIEFEKQVFNLLKRVCPAETFDSMSSYESIRREAEEVRVLLLKSKEDYNEEPLKAFLEKSSNSAAREIVGERLKYIISYKSLEDYKKVIDAVSCDESGRSKLLAFIDKHENTSGARLAEKFLQSKCMQTAKQPD